jgi:hypothetical protein
LSGSIAGCSALSRMVGCAPFRAVRACARNIFRDARASSSIRPPRAGGVSVVTRCPGARVSGRPRVARRLRLHAAFASPRGRDALISTRRLVSTSAAQHGRQEQPRVCPKNRPGVLLQFDQGYAPASIPTSSRRDATKPRLPPPSLYSVARFCRLAPSSLIRCCNRCVTMPVLTSLSASRRGEARCLERCRALAPAERHASHAKFNRHPDVGGGAALLRTRNVQGLWLFWFFR